MYTKALFSFCKNILKNHFYTLLDRIDPIEAASKHQNENHFYFGFLYSVCFYIYGTFGLVYFNDGYINATIFTSKYTFIHQMTHPLTWKQMDFVFGIDFLICISSFTILSLNQNLNSKFLITRSKYKTLNFGVNGMSFYKMIILII